MIGLMQYTKNLISDGEHAPHSFHKYHQQMISMFFLRSFKIYMSNFSISRRDVRCGCNRLYREHSWYIIDGEETVWNKKKHTKSGYNNAYGYISNTRAHYLRCDIETKPNILAKFMFEIWKIKSPRLIMCIIGGAKYFKLNERLEREFIKGIIQAALKAGK